MLFLWKLWPLFGGHLTKPDRGKLFYVPQVKKIPPQALLSLLQLATRNPLKAAFRSSIIDISVKRLQTTFKKNKKKLLYLVGFKSWCKSFVCPETVHDSGFPQGPSHLPWHAGWTEEEGHLWSGRHWYIPTALFFVCVCVSHHITQLVLSLFQVLKEYLDNVQLGHILDREGSWDSVQDWMDVLSGGEKQRMAVRTLLFLLDILIEFQF